MRVNVTRFVTRLGMQIISLIIAVIIWLYAVGEQSVEVTIKVPLRVSPPPGRMTVLSSTLQDITLRLSVPRNILSVISAQSVKAYHEIKGVETAGEYNFRIEPRDIQLPPGNVRILAIEPEVLTVVLDELIVQKLPIKVTLNGEPGRGYRVDKDKIDVNPNAVLIEGPKGKLSKLDGIPTEALDIVGRTRPFRRKVMLNLDPDLRSVTKNLLIDVFVPIRREDTVSVFHDVAVRVLAPPKKFSLLALEPETVSFALNGPKEVLDKLTNDDLLVYIDASALDKGEHEMPLQFKLPGETSLSRDQKNPVIKVKIG